MKGLNIKKIAAIGIGAALVGSALAPVVSAANVVPGGLDDLTKDDIVSATGQPVVDVVVGSNAAVSDVIWAGNIAARVAQLATVESGDAPMEESTVDITIGGSTTTTGAGETEEFPITTGTAGLSFFLDDSEVPSLFDDEVEYDINNDSQDDIDVKEYLYTNSDNLYASLQAAEPEGLLAGQFVGNADTNAFGYAITFDAPIANFDNDVDDVDLELPFLGSMWDVRELDQNRIVLRSNEVSEKIFVGDSVTVNGIGDYEGQTLDLVLTEVARDKDDADEFVAEFELRDGDTVIEVVTEAADGDDIQDEVEDYTDSEIVVDGIFQEVNNNQGYVRLDTGDQVLDLEDGEELDEDGNDDAEKWVVDIIGTSSAVSGIHVYNSSFFTYEISDADDDDLMGEDEDAYKMGPMEVGTSVDIADRGLYKFTLLGLTTEEMYTNMIGEENLSLSVEDNTYDIPVILGPFSEGEENPVEIAGEEYVLYLTDDSDTLKIFKTDNVDGDPEDETEDDSVPLSTYADNDFNDAITVLIDGDKLNDINYTIFGYWDDANNADYFLGLTGAQTLTGDVTAVFSGTYADKNDADELMVPYYLPTDMPNDIFDNWAGSDGNVLEDNDEDKYVAIFTIVDGNSDFNVVAHVDTSNGNLIDTGDDYAYISSSAPQAVLNTPFGAFDLDSLEDDELTTAGTDWGTEISVSDSILKMWVPDTQREVEAYLGSYDTTEVVEGGTVFEDLMDGETETKNGITVTANGLAQASSGVSVVPAGDLVKTDADGYDGRNIIVGGWLANNAARNLEVSEGNTLEDLLLSSGDYVAAVLASGDIVVAGFNANDTGSAASELIDALEDLM